MYHQLSQYNGGHYYQAYQRRGLGSLEALGFGKKLKRALRAHAARQAAAAAAARLKAAVEAEVARLVPTAEETAEAFAEEVKKIAPPLVTPPIVVTPYDEMKRHQLAPPPPLTMPPRVTTPVDSVAQPPPPAAQAAAFPLMQQFRREQMQIRAQPAANATAPEQIEAAQKKGAGIGTILALGIPVALMMMG